MPLYDFVCECGKVQEKLFSISECPVTIPCECGEKAVKTITLGHGGIATDGKVPWMADASDQLQGSWEKPFETRTEWKQYLSDRHLVAAG